MKKPTIRIRKDPNAAMKEMGDRFIKAQTGLPATRSNLSLPRRCFAC
jgi:hypothetical protein